MVLETALKAFSPVIAAIFPDKARQDAAKLKMVELYQNGEIALIEAQSDVITAEAKGEGYLQKNWRPITMLTFVGLIVAKWLGFTAAGITPELEMQLLEIIKVGLGGYVIGRSAEKVMKAYKAD